MGFDARAIEGHLSLDRSEFVRELEAAGSEGDDFDRRVFTTQVALDHAGYDRDLTDVQTAYMRGTVDALDRVLGTERTVPT